MSRSRTILQTITLNTPSATQNEVNEGVEESKYITPSTLKSKELKEGTYSTELTFDEDKDIYQDVSTPIFTLAESGHINGKGIFLRLNTPTSVTFPAEFEESSTSETLDPTKLNVYLLMFFSNWDGAGSDKVIYTNRLFTAI